MPGLCIAQIKVISRSIKKITPADLPVGWSKFPGPAYLKAIGDQFVIEGKHLMLKVPSAVNKGEYNYLINPFHKDFKNIIEISNTVMKVDKRLIQKSK